MTNPLTGPQLSRRQLLRAAAAAGLFAGVGTTAACAGPTGLPGPGTLTVALTRSLVSLDNKLNQFDSAVTVQRAVRQALTEIGPDITPVPVLAETMEPDGDTRWTVTLREGVEYSDGRPLKIDDVATALQMYEQVQGSFVASFFPEFPTVVPVDERTFHLDSEQPIPILDALMALILITPAEDNEAAELQEGVGTGPYLVERSNRGAGTYTLVRNDNYWGDAPEVERVEVRFLPEEASRIISVRSGEVDVIDSISPDSRDQLEGLPGVSIEESSSLRLNQIFYNFRKPASNPLSDARVREALSFAVDGESLVKNVFTDAVTAAEGVVPDSLLGYHKTGTYQYDPERARRMLDDLGVGDLSLKIIWQTGEFPADTSVMEALTEMFGAIDIRTELQQFEPGGNILDWRQGKAGDWDLLGNGFSSPTGLAITMLQGMYAGTAAKEETRDTYQGYVVEPVEAKITRAARESDPVRREKYLAEAQQAVWDSWPCAWAFVPKSVLARRERVGGLSLAASNSYPLADVRLEA
ncbi:ABC transporter substrate-binding protein [Zhihengliuella salsuginis]|uniref:ABC transporter substrate-binding protein n=1 Tax=Zhihengliuella salsuginis TaxID=578222 RepID=A0ABQ3GIW2_9MICC|nr:ABC transporter substrate-binding protein [Zhihengliuella salsuginis]GHD06073.1 ABC transporter substrate-binding protein [Zhihengliuella salsuginis]